MSDDIPPLLSNYTLEEHPPHTHDHIIISGFVDFSHTGDAFAIAFSVFLVGMFKILVSRVTKVPNSVMLLGIGVICGIIISLIYPGEVYLKPSWFFLYLLPIIVFEAGFCMKNKDFFSNLGTISLYAVVGTILNIFLLSVFLYYIRNLFSVELHFATIVLFSTIICAVDPVAVLTVFDDIGVNEVLYICVFGESLLNDAVTIVLYQAVNEMQTADAEPGLAEIGALVVTFLKVSIGGIMFGIIAGYITSLMCRLTYHEQQVQPIVLLFVPYMTYLLADSCHFSGLLALIICGMISKNYAQPNISEDLMRFTEVLLKFLCSYSEAAIFVFLGISLTSFVSFKPFSIRDVDIVLILFTLIGILVARFIGVFLLTYLVNIWRDASDKIGGRDQFIMAYGGLRGAVCYGLVQSLDGTVVPHKGLLVSTTIIVVILTTVLQGSTIKLLVALFQVKLSKKKPHGKENGEENPYKVFGLVQKEVQRRVVDFMESLTHTRRQNRVFHKFMEIDEKFIKPRLIAYYDNHSYIGDQHKLIEIEEYKEGIRCGSFAGLPHVSSAARLATSHSTNDMLAPNASGEKKVEFTLRVPDRPIPRNESISGLVQKTFTDMENDHRQERQARRSIYSRHQLEVPLSPATYDLDAEPSFDERNYIFTYPGPKTDRGKLARDIKAFAARQRTSAKSPVRRRLHSVDGRLSPPSVGRPTAAPTGSLRVPRFTISIEDETQKVDPAPTARIVRPDKKLSKAFTIGGEDAHELLPINEEHETSLDDSRRSLE